MPVIRYVKGDAVDLFKQVHTPYDAFAHGANCVCTMGSGVARDVADKLFSLYQEDQLTFRMRPESKLGHITFFVYQGFRAHDKKIAYNAYTQLAPVRSRDEVAVVNDAVRTSMRQINNSMVRNGLKRLVIPFIGCGLAHGDWDVLLPLINEATPDIEIDVVLWDKETDPKLLSYYQSQKVK